MVKYFLFLVKKLSWFEKIQSCDQYASHDALFHPAADMFDFETAKSVCKDASITWCTKLCKTIWTIGYDIADMT